MAIHPARDVHPGSPSSEGAAGFSVPELMFGLLLVVLCGAVLLNHLSINYRVTNSERDRVFAFGRAQAILAEIQSYVDRSGIDAAAVDMFDDGVASRPQLTVQTDANGQLLSADHVLSGNILRDGQWLWSRRITVQPMPGTGG